MHSIFTARERDVALALVLAIALAVGVGAQSLLPFKADLRFEGTLSGEFVGPSFFRTTFGTVSRLEGPFRGVAVDGNEVVVGGYINNQTTPFDGNPSFGGANISACRQCEAGKFCVIGSSNPPACSIASYCPPGSSLPTPCPGGTANPSFGGTNASACTLCAGGFYCPSGSSQPTVCPAGALCVAGSAAPSGRPAGFFCGAGVATPTLCPAGSFCEVNASQPSPCPRGSFCPSQGLGVPQTCPACELCPSTGLSAPQGCPAGFSCAAGSFAAQPCQAGTHCPANTSLPLECPVGVYCPGLSPTPTPCPGGTFGPDLGAATLASCRSCPGGSACPRGSSLPLRCSSGVLCVNGSEVPAACPAGSYCPSGVASAITCPGGSYCPVNSSTPTMCPSGSYCQAGSAAPSECPVGRFCAEAGAAQATACPQDTYANSSSSLACIACTEGTGTANPGAASVADCTVDRTENLMLKLLVEAGSMIISVLLFALGLCARRAISKASWRKFPVEYGVRKQLDLKLDTSESPQGLEFRGSLRPILEAITREVPLPEGKEEQKRFGALLGQAIRVTIPHEIRKRDLCGYTIPLPQKWVGNRIAEGTLRVKSVQDEIVRNFLVMQRNQQHEVEGGVVAAAAAPAVGSGALELNPLGPQRDGSSSSLQPLTQRA